LFVFLNNYKELFEKKDRKIETSLLIVWHIINSPLVFFISHENMQERSLLLSKSSLKSVYFKGWNRGISLLVTARCSISVGYLLTEDLKRAETYFSCKISPRIFSLFSYRKAQTSTVRRTVKTWSRQVKKRRIFSHNWCVSYRTVMDNYKVSLPLENNLKMDESVLCLHNFGWWDYPKSIIFVRRSFVTIILVGLKSKWVML
jgi:hypothetical protein